ncbi:NADH-quinone oxidoreductase subunit L [Buchnera aphidicola (Ceratoglyphina bambusae)]|uniref:NADH-quinone oxidoreductase subunit 5 family protein n=1 Tax=Buchnera aphidicola TaxID=9 RepID=UPI0031B87602
MSIILLTILSPMLGFFALIFFKKILNKKFLFFIGLITLFISFCSSIFSLYLINILKEKCFIFNIYNLVDINDFKFNISFLLDELSLSMLLIITGIGLLVYFFSYWNMFFENEIIKFFAYINLFISSMSILVLSDNFLLIYLGWESVGICSYLLVSFYYKDFKNILFSMKSFLISKLSDIFFLISIFFIYYIFHTFNIVDISNFLHDNNNFKNLYLVKFVCLFLFLASISKSAQFPFHTWLPYAMVGPTPASALIHSATMVTSGVYLISRIKDIFLFNDYIFNLISIFSLFSIVLGSVSAMFHRDIKKILAYSTISQIGYMFLSIGIKSWNFAISFLISHAIFKTLLFLSASSIIFCNKNEKDIFKMTFSNKKSQIVYFSFLIGLMSLMSFPIITLGFYSKGEILFKIFESKNYALFYIALFGAIFTIFYTARLMLNILFIKKKVFLYELNSNIFHNIPLCILLFLSTFFGIFIIPDLSSFFSNFFTISKYYVSLEFLLSIITIFSFFSYFFINEKIFFLKKIFLFNKIYNFLNEIFINDLYFNKFYNFLKNIYKYLSIIFYRDVFKILICFISFVIMLLNKIILFLHSGYLRKYILIFFLVSLLVFSSIIFI